LLQHQISIAAAALHPAWMKQRDVSWLSQVSQAVRTDQQINSAVVIYAPNSCCTIPYDFP
jgi:hypothetical protein